MSEEKAEKSRIRGEGYEAVMLEAAWQAKARAKEEDTKPLLTISDVFQAVCALYPDVFTSLLGRCVPVPKADVIGYDKSTKRVRYSSEVDRYFSPYGGVMEAMLENLPEKAIELNHLHIAAALVWEPIPEVKNLLDVNGINSSKLKPLILARLRREGNANASYKRQKELSSNFENIRKIREFLLSHCFGQDNAIEQIVTQLSIFWTMPPAERGSKPLSFFFAGAPGTGKNYLASLLQEAFEIILGIERVPLVDFARFSDYQLAIDLIGRDVVWQGGGHEGILTHAAVVNPKGLIIIDNFERGEPISRSHVESIIETGSAVDDYTKKRVSFAENVFIVITHERKFAESEEFLELVSADGGTPPRDKIIEGLVKFEPSFHSTLRVTDSPILFSKHTFNSFFSIIKDKLAELKKRFEEAYFAECEFESEDVLQVLSEMHPNVESAHPVVSAVESAVLQPIEDWLVFHYAEYDKLRRIRIECDPLPDFEGAPQRKNFKDFESWMSARTYRRIRQAKRLVFKREIKLAKDAVVLHLYDISYVVLPSIEDSDYFSVKVPDVSFDDLVGVDIVKECVSEVIDYFIYPDKGKVKPDTGIILYGPPGTGKTSVAKAIAKEMGVPFIMVTGADFTKTRRGEGVESVKKLFAVARRYEALIFIDEIDAIGSRDKSYGENAVIINTFLTELDGFHERKQLVIGATNRYQDLDEALVRPGRLSLKIQLGLLHRSDDRRKLILSALDKVEETVDPELLEKLVETTRAWSPANIIAMVNGGVRLARKSGEKLSFDHFIKARTIVLLGEDPQRLERSEKDIKQAAVHEAGHAVTAALLGVPFIQANIQGAGSAADFIEPLASQGMATQEGLTKLVDVYLGGRAAEELLAEPSNNVQTDFEQATTLVCGMLKLGLRNDNIITIRGESEKEFIWKHTSEIENILRERMCAVKALLEGHLKFLGAVCEALKAQKLLFEADVISIMEEHEEE